MIEMKLCIFLIASIVTVLCSPTFDNDEGEVKKVPDLQNSTFLHFNCRHWDYKL